MGKRFIRSANNLINSISIIWKIIKKENRKINGKRCVLRGMDAMFVWAEKIICLEKGKKV